MESFVLGKAGSRNVTSGSSGEEERSSARLHAPLAVRGLLLVLLLLASSVAFAQSFRGSIRGKVRDANGGLLAGAKVSAKNIDTGLSREALTGDDGAYVLAELPAGKYVVAASAPSLSPVAQNVAVNVGLDTTADFDLTQVEQHKEALTVTAEAPLVEASRDVLGEVVDRQLVNELPLNGRDFGKLVALVPGATVEPSGVAAVQSGFGQFAINGNRDRSNNYTLDGTDNNDPFFNNSALNQTGIGGAPASLLPIDAIDEFNLQSQFPAEYGRNSGSVVNIVTKSGTNQIHGTVFEFLRNDAMDARNYFNRTPAPKTGFKNNQFGGSIGGPIIKDKTFFFGAYEGQRERVGSDFTFLVPTNSSTVGGQSVPNQIALAQQLAAANGVTPSAQLTSLLALFPAPTGFNGSSGTVPGTVADKNDVNSLIAKVDHQFSQNETLTARYALAQSDQVFPLGGLGGGAASRLPQFAQTSPTRVQVVSASLLSALSSNRVNEIRFGYSRYRTSFSTRDANYDPITALGIDFGTGRLSLPEIDFGGNLDNLGATGFSIPRGRTSQSFQILDNFTWVLGRHTIKFGGEVRRVKIDNFNDNLARGQIEFGSSDYTDPTTGLVCPAGFQFCTDPVVTTLSNLYLGNSYNAVANTGNTQRTTYNNGLSLFAQDDFRVSPSLTLNFGMRWEYFGPISEAHNLLSNLGKDGMLAMVGTDGVSGAYARDLNNFGPRLGFAWNVHKATVVRGAYGIYYDYVPQDLLIANFTNSAGLITNPIGPSPILALGYNPGNFNGSVAGSQPGVTAPVFTPGGGLPCTGCDIFVTPRNFVTPYSQNWNLNIEHQLSNAIALQVGYVGSKGTKLVRLLDLNQADYMGNRPNTMYGAIDALSPISSSIYHALQLTVRARSWHGLSGFAGYTWSKSLDDASDGIDYNFSTVAFPQNSYNPGGERGASNFDTRHRFTAAFNYQVPRFAGPRWATDGWQLNTIITAQSGRPVPIVNSDDTSGANFNVFPTPANFHQHPDLLPGVNPINSNWESAPDTIGYLNGAAFADPPFATAANPQGSFGNLQRNSIYGPKFWNVDFALGKSFSIHDRVNLQIRAELFNIFNHPNFALPNFFVLPGGTQQGLITQTPDQAQTNPGLGGGGPRVVQLGLKLLF
jgi:hypothetical protein